MSGQQPPVPGAGQHQHGHNHGRDHGHDHSSGVPAARLRAALAVTAVIFLAEVTGGIAANSLALLADAGHMLVDSAGLVIALVAAHLARRPRSDQYTWGLARSEAISAAFQAGMLLVVCAGIVIEGAQRLWHPPALDPLLTVGIGAIGLVGNLISLAVLLSVRGHNLNLRAAFLEVATDSASSLGVIAGGIIAWATAVTWVDTVVSLAIAAVMAPRALSLLRRSLRILMERTPEELDLEEVRAHILRQRHVVDVHDLHVSTISTGMVALSAHITLQDCCFTDGDSLQTLHEIQDCLATHFPLSLAHSTIQLDSAQHRDHEVLRHST